LVCFVTNKFGKNGGEVLLLLSENAIISKLINLQKSQVNALPGRKKIFKQKATNNGHRCRQAYAYNYLFFMNNRPGQTGKHGQADYQD